MHEVMEMILCYIFPTGFFLDENYEERRAMPQMRTLCLGEQEEEALEHNSQSTTEDLFTIIHR